MRILVDFDLCQSHALCTQAAPEVFEVDGQGFLNVKLECPGEELREKVERAVRDCPTMAIAITED